jgi:hypothetical protein
MYISLYVLTNFIDSFNLYQQKEERFSGFFGLAVEF